jgi:hypothetical protein
MLRSLIIIALSLVTLAEASAQTKPAAAHKNTKKTAVRTTRRATKKTTRVAAKKAPVKPADSWDVWPAPAPVAVAPEPANRPGDAAVYAAPGMSVHIRTGREMDNYDGTPRKPALSKETTLSQR